MIRQAATSMLIGAVRKGTGATPAGQVTAGLLTTGASLLLTRGRRPVGLALLALGGLLLWHEVEKDQAAVRMKPAKAPKQAKPDVAEAKALR
jgi:hypothetical protein